MFRITRLPYIQVIVVMKQRCLACLNPDLEYHRLIMECTRDFFTSSQQYVQGFDCYYSCPESFRISRSALQQAQNCPRTTLVFFRHPFVDTHTRWVVTVPTQLTGSLIEPSILKSATILHAISKVFPCHKWVKSQHCPLSYSMPLFQGKSSSQARNQTLQVFTPLKMSSCHLGL